MMYTNEFFAVGNTAPNDDLVQLIDSFTGENVNFRKVSTWIDETILVPNDPRVLEDEIIYRSRGNDYYVNTVVFASKRVYVTSFGAKSSYTVDQRPAIQRAFDISSKLGLKLVFPSGHFLINSYSDDANLVKEHNNILELRSYLDIEFEEYSVIKVGEFFDDKAFILFSGFNHSNPLKLKPLYNITIKGKGVINFNGEVSQMRSSYMRRIGFDGGNCSNIYIDGLSWVNGDLSNCIGVGYGDNGNKATITNCTFDNLATGSLDKNNDHSTIYGNVNFMSVHNNIFLGGELMRAIGCPCEIHGSYSSFTNNKVYNYTRMNFISNNVGEKSSIEQITISGNIAEIANSGVYIWAHADAKISNVLINDNIIRHKHVPGLGQEFNGHQGLFVVLDKAGSYQNLNIKDNFCEIIYTINDNFRFASSLYTGVYGLDISGNHFIGHSLGFLFDKGINGVDKYYDFVRIENNNFRSASKIVSLNATRVNHCIISNNSTTLEYNDIENLIEINSDVIQSTTVRDNIYISNQPKVEFTPSSVFLADPSNKAKYVLSLVSTPVPTVNGGGSAFISPALSSNHKRVGGMYTIQPTYPFPELFFNAHTFGAGGTSDVKFKVDNMTSTNFAGNPNLVSNLIVNL